MPTLGDTILVDGETFATGVALIQNLSVVDGKIEADGATSGALRAILDYTEETVVGQDYMLSVTIEEMDAAHDVQVRAGGPPWISAAGAIGTFHVVFTATAAVSVAQVIFSTGGTGKVGPIILQTIVD